MITRLLKAISAMLVFLISTMYLYSLSGAPPALSRSNIEHEVLEMLHDKNIHVRNFQLEACKYGQPVADARAEVAKLPSRDERALLAVPVGQKNARIVDDLVRHFLQAPSSFDVWLFCYDASCSHWNTYQWATHPHVKLHETSGLKKWAIAYRHLEPGAQLHGYYSHIFFWDDDISLDSGFLAEQFLRFLQWGSIEICQPAVSENGHYRQGRNKGNTGLMHSVREVEIQVPVYSREAWDCVWGFLDDASGSGFGIDDYVHSCLCDYMEIFQIDFMTVSHSDARSLNKSGAFDERDRLKALLRDPTDCSAKTYGIPIREYCLAVEIYNKRD